MPSKSALLLIVALFVTTAGADVVEYDLNCDGYYWLDRSWSTNFDLGVTFSEISHIYLHWEGSITAAEFEPIFPNPIFEPYYDGRFIAYIRDFGSSTSLASKNVSAGEDTAPNPEPFDLQSLFSISDYSPLLDGTGSIKINFQQTYPLEWYFEPPIVALVSNASGQLDSAKLVFEGVIVPEPITILLFGLGSFALMRKPGKKLKS